MSGIDILSIPYGIAPGWTLKDLTDDESTWVQVMFLVPSGNKPLPEPMMTLIYTAIWHY